MLEANDDMYMYPMQSAAVSSSNAMEKEGLARSLQKLDEQGVSVHSLTTGKKASPLLDLFVLSTLHANMFLHHTEVSVLVHCSK